MKPPVDLQPGEQVLRLSRRHWMFLYPRLLLLLVIALVPPAGLLWILADRNVEDTARMIGYAVAVLWLVAWLVRTYFFWFRYQHDVWLITDQRLVDSLRRHWFHRQVASTDLVDIEDVSVHRSGPLQTAFNYGDVRCQTAGVQANFVLAHIPDPSSVLTQIDAARDAARRTLRGV